MDKGKGFREREERPGQAGGGHELRTRYEPTARIRLAYLNAVPWLDLLFVLFFLIWVQARLVLRPGVVVALPARDVQTGVQRGAVAVMTSSGWGQKESGTVFFGDEPFALDDPARMDALQQALQEAVAVHGERALTLYADARIRQAELMQVMELADKAGFMQFNLGTQSLRGTMP